MPSRSHAATSTSPISRAREVRGLREDALKAGPAVRLRGVVLRRWTAAGYFILQDKSDAIFVDMSRAAVPGGPRGLPAGLNPGALVEIEGVAAAGDFAPIVSVPGRDGIRVVGTAPLPAPLPLTAEAARAGVMDARLVVVEGVARRTRSTLASKVTNILEVVFDGTRLVVFLSRDMANSDAMLDARLRITGISSGIWNKQGQITAPCLMAIERSDITVLQTAPADPFTLRARSVADIMRYRPEDAPGHRMRIAGVVLHALPDGRVFVFDGERTVCAECTTLPAVVVGDAVDVVGFPGMRDRAPLLEDAVLRVRGHHAALPVATQRPTVTFVDQCKDYEFVQTEAVLLETQRTKTGTDLLLQSGDSLFKAAFDGPGPVSFLPALKPGTTLSLSGLVLFSFPSPTIQAFRPNGFSLLLRSPADVRILRQPSWWTAGRLVGVLSATVAIMLIFALWNLFLRSRMKSQQEIISAQARREATSEERTRLARELHDTLEQEFVGMTRQTEALEHAGPLTPPARGALDDLRQMLRLSRDNARRAVWDLRDPALLDCGLEVAIRNAVQRIVSGKGVVVNFHAEMRGSATTIPAIVQVNVLRLAQEAVTNAVKHSGAKTIGVVLKQRGETLELSVTDDGPCEDATGAEDMASAGHFGIIGMRERCEKLGGRFEFHSRPGGGVTVQARIPVAIHGQHSSV